METQSPLTTNRQLPAPSSALRAASESGFFNPRVLLAVAFCSVALSLAHSHAGPGIGTGKFVVAKQIDLGRGEFAGFARYPHFVAVGDVNGDGRPDLITEFSAVLGNGDGSFQPPRIFGSSLNLYGISVAVGDFNGDGDLDVAVLLSSGVEIYLGDGVGNFALGATYGMSSRPIGDYSMDAKSIAAGDLNSDGNLDLVVISQWPAGSAILLGNGDGTFLRPILLSAGDVPESVAMGDLNADGNLDLVVACFGDPSVSDGSVSVLLGTGTGIFLPPVSFAAGNGPISVALGDLNGDGKLDAAVADYDDGSVNILLGNGDGTFQAARQWNVGVGPLYIVLRDFNHDGDLDLAVANGFGYTNPEDDTNNDTVTVRLGRGDGTFQPEASYDVGQLGPGSSIAVADFNGDNEMDFVTNRRLALGKPDGTFQAARSYPTGPVPVSVVVGDLTNDGKPDLAVASVGRHNTFPGEDGYLSSLTGNGDGTFTPVFQNPVPVHNTNSVALGDFKLGDGNLDAVVTDGAHVIVARGLGNGILWPPLFEDVYAVGSGPFFITTGDFNGDSRPDLVVLSYNQVNIGLSMALSFTADSPTSVAVGDFNGDGKSDLAVTGNGENGAINVFLGKGDRTFDRFGAFAVGSYPRAIITADFNGDGKSDLALANDDRLSILAGNGDGTFQSVGNYDVASSPQSIAAADFNGDGKLDLAVAIIGNVSVLSGKGDGSFFPAENFAANSGDSVAAADFNGDGAPDLVVTDARCDHVTVLLNIVAPKLANIVSRKIHGSNSTFDVDLPLTGNAGIECRSGGPIGEHQLVMTFAAPVTFTSAEVMSGFGTVSSTSGSGTSTITVNLSGVANAQNIIVTLIGVSDGTNTGNVSIQMSVLLGDTTADGSVNSADIAQTKSQSGNAVNSSNFREDVTADGSLNSADIALVKSKSGTALP